MSVVYRPNVDANGEPSTTYTDRTAGQRTAVTVNPDGEKVQECFPHLPYITAIDPDGNECFVAVSTNRNHADSDAKYEKAGKERMKRRGWLIPEPHHFKFSTDAHGRQRAEIVDAAILAEIAKRKAAAKDRTVSFAVVGKSEIDKATAQLAGTFEKFSDSISETMRGVKPRTKGGE